MTSPQNRQEVCIAALHGECGEEPDCPKFHAGNRAAALWEYSAKRTTQACAYHLRAACTRGHACRSLHVLPAGDTTPVTETVGRGPYIARNGNRGNLRRQVPRGVRLASQVRGKMKLFDEIVRLANQTAKLDEDHAQRARNVERHQRAFELELEHMATRFEQAIQTYSQGENSGAGGTGRAPRAEVPETA